MLTYVLKPVVWNTKKYQKPSGESTFSGYPHEYGYGGEEWNNSPKLKEKINGQVFRYLHTEPLGNLPVDELGDQIVLMLISSHDGLQQLVGIAGQASWIEPEEGIAIAKRLKLGSLWQEAWKIPQVQSKQTKQELRVRWQEELEYKIRWRCPESHFLWLDKPLTLNAASLVGKQRFTSHYGRYQIVTAVVAKKILMSVPEESRNRAWESIISALRFGSDVADDIDEIKDSKRSKTTIKTLVDARLGQGKFRTDLMKKWGRGCAVAGSFQSEVLKASHVKPWKVSSDEERLDPDNGILLSANIDSLFDRWLVTFDKNGNMQVSRTITTEEKKRLKIPAPLTRKPTADEQRYLVHHQKIFLSKEKRRQ